MKAILKFLIGLCFCCLIIYLVWDFTVYMGDVSDSPAKSSDRPSVSARIEGNIRGGTAPPKHKEVRIETNAYQLMAEYQANEVAADMMYKGKLLTFAGVISEIGKDILNKPYVALFTNDTFSGIQCYFHKSDEPALAVLRKDTKIVLSGRCRGKMGHIIIEDCVIEAKKD